MTVKIKPRKLPSFVEGRICGLLEAADICRELGDQCAGGSGREIVPNGPNRGQQYGHAYYNLADSIENRANEHATLFGRKLK